LQRKQPLRDEYEVGMAFEATEGGGSRRGTRVEARCAWCGPVAFDLPGLAVHVGSVGEALIEFGCPDCARLNVRAIGESDLQALLVAGIRPAVGPAPFELLEEHSGPPIGWDDLLDFHESLAAPDLLRSRRIDREPAPGGPGRERHAA
jgi:hypothetical protein